MYQTTSYVTLKYSLIVVLRSILFFIYSIFFLFFIIVPIFFVFLLIGLRGNILLFSTFILMCFSLIIGQNLFSKWKINLLKYFYFEETYLKLKKERQYLKYKNIIEIAKSKKSLIEIEALLELSRYSLIKEIENKNKKWLYRVGLLSTWSRDEVDDYFNYLHELLLLDTDKG